ncbi:hypothetical protein EIP86_000384 [Pleurotus ostreatoroseus]|nr:hypothetical protein EIP86_000384 [Pleurotus ostreatoroseus]
MKTRNNTYQVIQPRLASGVLRGPRAVRGLPTGPPLSSIREERLSSLSPSPTPSPAAPFSNAACASAKAPASPVLDYVAAVKKEPVATTIPTAAAALAAQVPLASPPPGLVQPSGNAYPPATPPVSSTSDVVPALDAGDERDGALGIGGDNAADEPASNSDPAGDGAAELARALASLGDRAPLPPSRLPKTSKKRKGKAPHWVRNSASPARDPPSDLASDERVAATADGELPAAATRAPAPTPVAAEPPTCVGGEHAGGPVPYAALRPRAPTPAFPSLSNVTRLPGELRGQPPAQAAATGPSRTHTGAPSIASTSEARRHELFGTGRERGRFSFETGGPEPAGPREVPPHMLTIGDSFPPASPPVGGALWSAPNPSLSPSPGGASSSITDILRPHQDASPPEIPSDAETQPPLTQDDIVPAPLNDSRPYAFTFSAEPASGRAASPALTYIDPSGLAELPPWQSPLPHASPPRTPGRAQGLPVAHEAIPGPTAHAAPTPAPLPILSSMRRTTGIAAQLDAADRARPQPASGAARNGVAFRITPKPAGGFRRIQHASAGSLFDGQHRPQTWDWDGHPGLKLGIQLADSGARDIPVSEFQSLPNLVLETIGVFLGHNGPRIAVPDPAKPPRNLDEAPLTFLLWNLSQEDYDRLCDHPIIAAAHITILVHEFAMIAPYMIGFVRDFDTDNPREIHAIVRTRLARVLPAILTIAAEDNDEIAAVPDRRVLEKPILDSLCVTLLPMKAHGDTDDPQFNVYAHLPIIRVENFDRARQLLIDANWTDSFLGHGAFAAPKANWCLLCHAADHPRGLCPLPNIPGWLGPTHDRRRPPRAEPIALANRRKERDNRRPDTRNSDRSRDHSNGPGPQRGSNKRRFGDDEDQGGRKTQRTRY